MVEIPNHRIQSVEFQRFKGLADIQKTKEKKLVAKPSDTFWKAIEKVLDGFEKNGGK